MSKFVRVVVLWQRMVPGNLFPAQAIGDSMGTLRIWDVNESGPGFGKCVKTIVAKSNCHGMKISGARGLEQKMKWRLMGEPYEGTLLEYFIECGAIPDEKQKKQLAELKKKKKKTRKKKPGA